ncbi:Uu.00g111080.m01.CDS01 [Anthostomella pinea]|uniref:Uu.00g111080.m01.CDS01 n=1 Tax=Anthostomella pinea TaxID=933095 RepID=A0AAI8VG01_9PEZI|nr:Uu.00g111080.m01.CDS01 [Anthostomella pinea]
MAHGLTPVTSAYAMWWFCARDKHLLTGVLLTGVSGQSVAFSRKFLKTQRIKWYQGPQYNNQLSGKGEEAAISVGTATWNDFLVFGLALEGLRRLDVELLTLSINHRGAHMMQASSGSPSWRHGWSLGDAVARGWVGPNPHTAYDVLCTDLTVNDGVVFEHSASPKHGDSEMDADDPFFTEVINPEAYLETESSGPYHPDMDKTDAGAVTGDSVIGVAEAISNRLEECFKGGTPRVDTYLLIEIRPKLQRSPSHQCATYDNPSHAAGISSTAVNTMESAALLVLILAWSAQVERDLDTLDPNCQAPVIYRQLLFDGAIRNADTGDSAPLPTTTTDTSSLWPQHK